ncbi:hypothetical protein B0I33_110232 [Prauserella shujinwangii]|uniref:Extracellular solute-binding protein n=1 Tax=Prauserella shujinwangii TaxID=1453103 RepID=A0A2T0LPH6_9PSEU|nr:hypothetical protein [Prauserella shujinwangii]PRX45133.1 hypothetical protein B0I33_110232 [Prauserella shujinwangii]
MGRHSRVETPERPDSVTSTGTHRAVGKAAGRRRVAAWPIACLVLVGLLVAGWFGWNWADGVLQSRAEALAAGCQEGDARISVVVDPAAEQPVTTAAQRWNAARTVVHGHCITVAVHTAASDQVLDVLLGDADPGPIGGTPSAWLPATGDAAERLRAERPELVGSLPESVTGTDGEYPYLALAGAGVDDVQERAAQSFGAYLTRPAQQAAFTDAGLSS